MKNTIKSINPYTEELNGEFELLDKNGIDEKINLAQKAFLEWKKTSKIEKKKLFLKLAEIIENDIEQLAKLQTIEMGMLYSHSKNGLKSTVKLIKWFANNFEEILKEEEFEIEGEKGKTMYDPLGVLFGVAPWNFPYSQVLRAAVPNILAGNTIIYKHASNVPICAGKIEELFLNAGFKSGIYQNLYISSSDSEYIISKSEIKGVNLTGGELAGKSLGSLAGKYLKPSVMELGGNDVFIVCDTNNLDEIVKQGIKARISNGGQKCNSSKIFLVQEKYYEEFCEKFKIGMENLILGDPMNEKTELQPLAKEELIFTLENQVSKTINEGAILLTGGKRINKKGFFFAPTVLKNVTKEMTSYKEEVFGPVASIIKVKDLNEAIKVANSSDFGLCSCVYGDNIEQLKEVANKIEAGMVFLNKPAGSRAFLPFGGIKKSGFGKENGPEGLKAFTNKKVIVY